MFDFKKIKKSLHIRQKDLNKLFKIPRWQLQMLNKGFNRLSDEDKINVKAYFRLKAAEKLVELNQLIEEIEKL